MAEERFAIANLTGGQLNALVKILGGESVARQVLSHHLIMHLVKPYREYTTWIGGKSRNEYRERLLRDGCRIGPRGERILNQMAVDSGKERQQPVVIVSVAGLGLQGGAKYEEISTVARAVGLTRCMAEIGPALRHVYRDQLWNEHLFIAMDPVEVDGESCIFAVNRDEDTERLDGCACSPARVWQDCALFAFVWTPRPKH